MEKKTQIDWKPFPKESSNLVSWAFPKDGKALFIKFKSGHEFKYTGVPQETALRVINGEIEDSAGKTFNALVKGKFPEEKIIGS